MMRYSFEILRTLRRAALAVFAAIAIPLSVTSAVAQTGGLMGTVVDQGTGQPIEGATVRVVGTAFAAKTKADGTFTLANLTRGTYTVSAEAAGYRGLEKANVIVGEQMRRSFDFELVRTPSTLTITNEEPVIERGRVTGSGGRANYPVRTFPLQHLRAGDAAKLLSPYMPTNVSPGATGVFDAGMNVSAITVRAPAEVLATIDSVLRVYDRAPVTVVLRFKLIVAVDSAVRDPATAEIGAALKGMFSFAGYRLVDEATTTVNENATFETALKRGEETLTLNGTLGSSAGTGPNLAHHVSVNLSWWGTTGAPGGPQGTARRSFASVFDVPNGQTIVIGGWTGTNGEHLILAVRPEVAPSSGRR